MFRSAHIWTKQQFTSLALLLRLSFLGTIRDTNILLSLDFNDSASSIIDLAIWLAVRSEFRSLVPQWRIIWSGLTSRIVGFTWSCMHLTFAELNGRTLTRHLCLSFLVNKKPFNFFTMLSPSMNTVSFEICDGDGEMTLSLLMALFLLLLLISLLILLLSLLLLLPLLLLSSYLLLLLSLGFLRLIVTLVPLIESLVLSVSIILLLLSLLLALLLVSMMLLSLFLLLQALLILEKYCYY